MCQTACAAALDTPFRMGGIHPRSKTQVGDRLATAYYNTLGGGKGAWVGPTLSGCTADADSLHIMFNTTLLMGDTLKINKWGEPYLPPVRHASPYGGSYLYVQTNASQFCMEKTNVVNASGGVVPGMEGKYLRTLTGTYSYLPYLPYLLTVNTSFINERMPEMGGRGRESSDVGLQAEPGLDSPQLHCRLCGNGHHG
tara:strand:+ start:1660 stop:2250 length:591 start_codon:yes stop_codon:yes gene_type:complete